MIIKILPDGMLLCLFNILYVKIRITCELIKKRKYGKIFYRKVLNK